MNNISKLAGIIGYPIVQSLSPLLHRYWLEEYGVSGEYVPLAAAPNALSKTVRALQDAGFVGLNVTLPHKEAAYSAAHQLDNAARSCGAANLILFHSGGRIEGRNTDATGLAASLVEEIGIEYFENKSVVLLGAGGAARAAVLALDQMGVGEIRVLGRSLSRVEALRGQMGHTVKTPVVAWSWRDWPRAAKDSFAVLNATSGGMFGKPVLDLPLDPLPKRAAVYDLVYNPLETNLLKEAQLRGNRSANGLGMLIHQAIPAFAAFYGVTPSATPALRAKLEKALAQ
ncbi:MAG TPA: shikimate dehydrogenase [Rhizomicrobium sp.]|jgi:shikimate dehydrogenase|nr:shikimate dehydrogenase [Rhizomicrobium sp.]